MKAFLRKILPRKLINLLGFYVVFFHKKKHHRLDDGFYNDISKNYLPWFTYPCIEFLKTLEIKNCNVLEFGSGSSTIFWSMNCKSVISLEKDRFWYFKLKKKIQNHENNIQLNLVEDDLEYSNFTKKKDLKFDIIVIDGAVRKDCILNSINKIDKDGFFILDNTEWYPNSAKYLRDKGFTQFDFSGFSPLNSFTSCTSIFFKSLDLFKNRKFFEKWHPVGGRYLKTVDD